MGDEIEHSDAEAALRARHELGSEYDEALVTSFAERIEQTIQARVTRDVAERSTPSPPDQFDRVAPFVLGLLSLGALIPISIVLGLNGQMLALIIAVVGIAAVNAAHASVVNARLRR